MKKRILSFIFAIAMVAVGVLSAGKALNAYALSIIGQTADEYFLQTIQEFGYDQEVDYIKNGLFNENLQNNGFEYIFEIENEKGYALMIKCFDAEENQLYEIMEIFFEAESPFAQAEGDRIYVKMFHYFDYIDGRYYDLTTGEEIIDEILVQIAEDGFNYSGSSLTGTNIETIDYNYKSDYSYEFAYGIPSYYRSDYSNACSNIAGGIILGYYDIWYQEFIPNYTTNYLSNGKWKYYPQDYAVDAVINDLYFKMQTNVYGGTSVANFKSGLTSYVAAKGRSTSYTSVMSSSSFDYSKYKSQVNSSTPVAIFTGKYNVIDKDEFYGIGKKDYVTTYYYNVNHTMIGSGYREVSYNRNETVSVWSPVWYNPFRYVNETRDVNFRNDTYLRVSPAFSGCSSGYMRLNDNATINDAYGVKIS